MKNKIIYSNKQKFLDTKLTNLLKNIFSIQHKGNHTLITIFAIKLTFFNSKSAFLNLYQNFTNLQRITDTHKKIIDAFLQPSQLPQAKGDLRKRQEDCIKILKDIKNICNQNNLPYWIDFGTLLGAVRHKGFIPWDYDIDISMLRDDMYKLIPKLKEYYNNSDIVVREQAEEPHYQIRILTDKHYSEVDIFPVDKYYIEALTPDKKLELNTKIKKAADKFEKLCFVNTGIDNIRQQILQITNDIILEGQKAEITNPILFYGIDYPHEHENWLINYADIFPLQEINFENTNFSCPHNITERLKQLFGKNYMNFPNKFYSTDLFDEYLGELNYDK